MPTPNEMRAARADTERAWTVFQRQHPLPPLPSLWDDPRCGCGVINIDDLRVVEEGYSQWCGVDEVDVKERWIHAYTDGWDDMSETGGHAYLICQECGTRWEVPKQLEWN